ncbi:MAG: BTAD domain-containing putative transcriptional regulator, partial [Chloroflexota bacterium]
FGPLQVTINEAPAEFRTDALRVLLAYLAAHQGTPQRRDTLAGLLSPDRPDKEALTYLRNRLTRLRQSLGDEVATPPWLEIDRKQIALRTGSDIMIDVMFFDQHLKAIENHSHRQLAGCPICLDQLQAAVDLVQGEFLGGLNFPNDIWETWLLTQREHYHQRALEAMTLLRETWLAQGAWDEVLIVAQRQLILEPWLEVAHRDLMLAHYQLSDRNAALAQFEQCKQQLWEELGVEPEEETQLLRQQILDQVLPQAGKTTLPNNLPLQTSRFFGRQSEQGHLLRRLVDPAYRLLTLVGIGGVGKTRLAIEVGQQVKPSFPDGVWFVPLVSIKGGAEQIKIAVGEAIGLGQDDKQLTGEQVLALLRDKQLLLILDNCDLLLDELAFISEWLNRAPHIAILATSREPLNFAAESLVILDGLSTSDEFVEGQPVSAAVAMFAERGQMARNDFVVSAENISQIRQICELVDGFPLGIALAAAWVRRRSLGQIIDTISQSLDFLSTRLRDIDPRHRSMRAVFETSWQLLESETQAMLAALSVFPTSFSAKAAERVAGAQLFDLDLLCEKSLLQQQNDSERYVMHSLVRQFAAGKLTDHQSEIDRAFVDYFYQFACDHQADYTEFKPEWANFLAVIRKGQALEAWSLVLDLVQVLDKPWFQQARYGDMRAGLGIALEAATALKEQPALARTRLRLAEIEIELNAYQSAETYLEEAIKQFVHLEDMLNLAQSQYLLGIIKSEQTEDNQALVLFEASKQIFDASVDVLGVAKNLNLIAMCHLRLSQDIEKAQRLLEQAVALQQRLPMSDNYVETFRFLGRIHLMAGDYNETERYLYEASDMSRHLDDPVEYAAVLYERTVLCRIQLQADEGLALGYECLESFKKQGSLRWEGMIKVQLGLLHQMQKEYQQAQTLLDEGLHIFVELKDPYEQAFTHYFLYVLYHEMGQPEESLRAKQQALMLNRTVSDPNLAAWLEEPLASN